MVARKLARRTPDPDVHVRRLPATGGVQRALRVLAAGCVAAAVVASAIAAEWRPEETRGPLWLPLPERILRAQPVAPAAATPGFAAAVADAAQTWGLGAADGLRIHSSLPGAHPAAIYSVGPAGSTAAAGDPGRAARDFLAAFAPVYGLTPSDLAGVVQEERPGLAGGREVVLSQLVAGRRLYAARLRVHFAGDGAFVAAVGTLYGGLRWEGDEKLSQDAAHARAAAFAAKLTGAAVPDADDAGEIDGMEEVAYPLGDIARPAWVVSAVAAPNGIDRFEMVVDAVDGRILEVVPLTWYDGPQGQVFTSSSPQPSLTPGIVPPAPNPPAYSTRSVIPFVGDAVMDPSGWVTGSSLAGNNATVRKYPTWQGGGFYAGSGTDISAAWADFQFPLLLGLGQPDIRNYADATGTNLFNLVNVAHDYFYSLGFDEAHGNFQADNLGRGGAQNDSLLAFTQLGAGTPGSTPYESSNAWMSTPADGSRPLMGMYIWGPHPGSYFTDSSLDAEVVLHEFAHGVTGRLGTGFWGAQGGAINEGNSDALALNFLTGAGAPVAGSYPAAAYSGQEFTTGIRNYPYSTQLAVNPLTYDDFGRVTDDGPEVHRDGEIWAVAMWELRGALIGRHGHAEGRTRTAQLLVDALQLAPDFPSMIAMRDALLAAERNRYAGADQDVLWQAFAKRGMGFMAAGGDGLSNHVLADGGIPTPAAHLRLWENDLFLGETVRLLVGDTNASAAPQVSLTTSNGDSETVTLAQDGAVYSGAVAAGSGAPVPGNGTLELAAGATLTATTTDGNRGGDTPSLSDTASVHAAYAIGQSGNLFDAGLATTLLGKGDDARWRHALPFPFVFYGVEYATVWVSSNGLLTFGGGESGWYESIDESRALPFISPFATDLVTNGSAQPDEGVYYFDGGDRFTVIWRAQEYGQANPVNAAASLFPDGSIRFDYGAGNQLWGSSASGPHRAVVGLGRGTETFTQPVDGYNGATQLGSVPSILFLPVGAGSPEVAVAEGGHAVLDGQAEAVFFGGAAAGGTGPTRTFTVRNDGYAALSLGTVTVPAGFTVTEGLAASLSPGVSDTFTVRMGTATAGVKSGTVTFATGDADENPFDFPISGSVVTSLFVWDIQKSGTANRLVDVDFSSADEGWVAAQRGLLHTVDSGTTWSMPTSGTFHYALRFRDAMTGARVGSCGFSRTTDAGQSWSGFWWTTCSGFSYTDVFPASADVVWLSDTAGRVTRWTFCPGCGFANSDWSEDSFSTPGSRSLNAVYFTDLDTGWVAGASGTIIRITNANGGSPTFTTQPTGTGAFLYDLQMLDATTGVAVGQGGTILRTGNGGATWVPQDSHTEADLLSVDFADANHGLAAGQGGLVLATSDGGATWLREASVVDVDLRGVAHPTPESGFAVGSGGTILHRFSAATAPEVSVFEGTAGVRDGQSSPLHYGFAAQGSVGPTRTFTVRNDGGVALALGTPGVPAGFTLTEGLAASLAPGASDSFTVRLDTATAGAKSGVVTFSTNDPNENPFDFAVTGSVLPANTFVPCAGDVPMQVPDHGTVTSTLSIGGASTGISDVNVLLKIAHSYDSDLNVYLIGPTGTRVELFTSVGSNGENFTNTVLDDEAAVPITSGSAPFLGSFRPEGSLAALDGANPNGVWRLELSDAYSGDIGSLESWCLAVATAADPAPEILVLDGTASISDGQPSAVSFGSARHGAFAPAKSFVVRNDGTAALTLGTPSVPAGFTLTDGLAASLAPGAWDTFTVRMETATTGTKSGDVSFANNDPDESPFNFAIAGTVDPIPEIAVSEGANAITDGQVTPVGFGDVATGAPAPTKVFTVRNDGAATLTLGTLSVPAGFTVTDSLASTIASGAADTFAIQMGTSVPGPKTGEVRFENNDPDENPFSFPLSGMVTGPPEVAVLDGATPITDGQTAPVNIGSAAQGTTGPSKTFTVRNDGGAALVLGAVSVPAGFTLTDGLADTLAAGAADTFTVRLDTAALGARSGEVSFANDDSDENPFTFPIAGNVLAPGTLLPCAAYVPRPIDGSATVTSLIPISGATTGVADVNVTFTITHAYDYFLDAYLIGPTGTRVELFTGVGSNGHDFVNTELDDEAATALYSGAAPFTGSFRPEGSLAALDDVSPNGTWTLELKNGSSYYTGSLVGWCLTVATAAEALPEITVLAGGTAISDGQSAPVSLGFGALGTAGPTRTFTVRNDGTAELVVGAVTVPAGFTLTEGLPASLAPGASDTFTVRLDTGAVGTRSGTLSVANNDPNESPFDFPVSGTVGTLAPCAGDVPKAVPTSGTSTSSLSIAGATTAITDVNVLLTITHSYDYFLDVHLIGPTGIRVELFTGVGSNGHNFVDTMLDDEAATSITWDSAPFTGSFRPEGSLSALDGGSPNGTWTLQVTSRGFSAGSIVSWCLAVTTAAPEITVLDGLAEIADGETAAIDVGSASPGAAGPTRTFTVRNDGDATLTLGSITVPAGFTLTEGLPASLAPGASDTFTVRLDTRIGGTRRGQIVFANNDGDENPFSFAIAGTVRGRPRQHL